MRPVFSGKTAAELRRSPHWTALLSHLTGRAFVGGLDPEAAIEHTAGGLIDQTLAGRSLDDWKDAELRALLRPLQHRLGGLLVREGGSSASSSWQDATEVMGICTTASRQIVQAEA